MYLTPCLRTYSQEDRSQCLRIFDSNRPRYFAEPERTQFESFLDQSGCPYYVVEQSGVIVGCGGYAIAETGQTAVLCWGMIDAASHRQRLGELLLLGRLRDIITGEPVATIRLSTSQLTQEFYGRRGFAVVSRTTNGLAEGLDKVEMRLDLTDLARRRILERWQIVAAAASGPQVSG